MERLAWFALLATGGCEVVFPLDESSCPANYETLGGSHYRFSTDPAAFSQSEAACHAEGTHLAVVVSTPTEINLLSTYIHNTLMLDEPYWIGLSNRASVPTYQWVTDEPVAVPPNNTAPWRSMEPNQPATLNCVTMTRAGPELDDDFCSIKLRSICECDGFGENPTHF